VKTPVRREIGKDAPILNHPARIAHPEDTLKVWYAEVDEEVTTIYANFAGADPNQEEVEINVRQFCFYPDKPGRNYITVRGFEIAQAATPFVPPTADQPGMIGAHWSKGWIIENNDLHDSKCSAVSIGKDRQTGHNFSTRRQDKPGYQYQMEAVFRAEEIGWNRDRIGSHIIRNNVIHDCGQNGIVGHMGCVFSEIYGNHIYNIAAKKEFYGWEIGGIKLHAAIDVYIHHNRFDHSTLGIWLDWEAQGTRVSNNLFYANDRDLMIEVTSGPCLVDNNIFASVNTIDNIAQGTAFVNNIFNGKWRREDVLDRATPYHFAHSTKVLGYAFIYSGDDRIYNNIFEYREKNTEVKDTYFSGTKDYDGHLTSIDEYTDTLRAMGLYEDHVKFFKVRQPVYIANNAYTNGAEHFDREEGAYETPESLDLQITEETDGVYMEIKIPAALSEAKGKIHGTDTLGRARLSECIYDAPDGSRITLDEDYFGKRRSGSASIGPIEGLTAGKNRIKVW
jgi:hypothetical protein